MLNAERKCLPQVDLRRPQMGQLVVGCGTSRTLGRPARRGAPSLYDPRFISTATGAVLPWNCTSEKQRFVTSIKLFGTQCAPETTSSQSRLLISNHWFETFNAPIPDYAMLNEFTSGETVAFVNASINVDGTAEGTPSLSSETEGNIEMVLRQRSLLRWM